MFKIAICDDDKYLCHDIENTILSFADSNGLKISTEVFFDGRSLSDYITDYDYFDLIFLDIEMSDFNGIEVGSYIRSILKDYNTDIVYISSKDIYDRQLFDMQPLQFLPKPLNPQKIGSSLLLSMKRKNALNHCYYFRNGKDFFRIPYNQILYFESSNRMVRIVCASAEYSFYGKLNCVEQELPNSFSRIHRCYVVNRNQIFKFSSNSITLNNNTTLPVGQSYLDDFKKKQLEDIDCELIL